MKYNIDPIRRKILDSTHDLLIIGGAGSGKTTIALLKAKTIVQQKEILPWQKILFLSFANATVNKIRLSSKELKDKSIEQSLSVSTYHSFEWEIIKAHAYLVYGKNLNLLHPDLRNRYIKKDANGTNNLNSLLEEEGLIDFDLFPYVCTNIFGKFPEILKAYCSAFPVVVVDEFQDTSEHEWILIKHLQRHSRIIALADEEQRIYSFRGADPKRISEYTNYINPEIFDLQSENKRSFGTDILDYGNDVLTGKNKHKNYSDCKVRFYNPFIGEQKDHIQLKSLICNRIRDLKNRKQDWSLVVLVPSNRFMMEVSEALLRSGPGNLPSLTHNLVINTAATNLAAQFISSIMQYLGDASSLVRCIDQLVNYLYGRRDNKQPTQADTSLIKGLEKYIVSGKCVGSKRNRIINEIENLLEGVKGKLRFVGDPGRDWNSVLQAMKHSLLSVIQEISSHANMFVLIRRGGDLYNQLLTQWIEHGRYINSIDSFNEAILKSSLYSDNRIENGVSLMTIHKSKGKEFDEVIIYEGVYEGRLLPYSGEESQSKMNLRVAVTRARSHVNIMTPFNKPSPLL